MLLYNREGEVRGGNRLRVEVEIKNHGHIRGM